MDWLRWYNGTIDDKKWRAVSRKSGVPVSAVVAVWAAMCENANQSPVRGTLDNWDAEDVAAALDLETEQVQAIEAAMQGKVLSGPLLTGWEKRNPKKEDPTAAERQRRRRDSGVTERDSLAREEVEVDRELEKETDSTTTRKLRASAGGNRDEQINGVIRAANRGMHDNPAIGSAANPIDQSHGSRQDVYDLLNAGVPAELAEQVTYEVARTYKPSPTRKQPHTMKYFTNPIREAHDNGIAGIPGNRGVEPKAGGKATGRRGRLAGFSEDGDGTGGPDKSVRLRAG